VPQLTERSAAGPTHPGLAVFGEDFVNALPYAAAGFVDDGDGEDWNAGSGYLDIVVSADPFSCADFRQNVLRGGPDKDGPFRGVMLLAHAASRGPGDPSWDFPVSAGNYLGGNHVPFGAGGFLPYVHLPELDHSRRHFDEPRGELELTRLDTRPGGRVTGWVRVEGESSDVEPASWRIETRFDAVLCDVTGLRPPKHY